MLFFDLRWVLFGLLLLLSAVVALVVWLERRRGAKGGSAPGRRENRP